MNLPQTKGRYKAYPREWGLSEQGENRLPTFVCQFDLMQFFQEGQWVDTSADQEEISGFFYLLKKDGKLNSFTIDSLKKSLGWDGSSFSNLANMDWSQTPVQLTIDFETYNGKTRPKVQFINHADYDGKGGGIADRLEPQAVQSLDAKYGALLRATAGASASQSTKTPPPNTGAQKLGPIEQAKRAAWDAFGKAWDAYVAKHPNTGEEKNDRWLEVVGSVTKGKDKASVVEADWRAVAGEIAKGLQPPSPISADPQFADDDIPF